jgi:hypothetical protein
LLQSKDFVEFECQIPQMGENVLKVSHLDKKWRCIIDMIMYNEFFLGGNLLAILNSRFFFEMCITTFYNSKFFLSEHQPWSND